MYYCILIFSFKTNNLSKHQPRTDPLNTAVTTLKTVGCTNLKLLGCHGFGQS